MKIVPLGNNFKKSFFPIDSKIEKQTILKATWITVIQEHFKKDLWFKSFMYKKIQEEIFNEKQICTSDILHKEIYGTDMVFDISENIHILNEHVENMYDLYRTHGVAYINELEEKIDVNHLIVFSNTINDLENIYSNSLYLKDKFNDFKEFKDCFKNLGITIVVGESYIFSDLELVSTDSKERYLYTLYIE